MEDWKNERMYLVESICISESSWNIWKIQEWGTRVYPWWIHVDVWQNQYNIVKLKKKQ